MIKYDNNNINDWNFNEANINKVYYGVTSGTSLPYDAEIEYLESSGTQYINTNKYLTNTSNFEIGYEVDGELPEGHWGYVHQMVVNGAWVTVSDNYAFFGKWEYWVPISSLTSSAENTVVYKSNSGVTVNGTFNPKTLNLTNTDNIATVPLHIFATYDFNRHGLQFPSSAKIKSFYLKVDDTLVLDLIPVRVGQVGYMYDKVSGELFGNSGTGDFILGEDKTTPISAVGNVVYQKITTGDTPTPPTPTPPYTELEYIQLSDSTNKGGIQLLNTPKEGLLIEIDFELSGSSYSGDYQIIGQKSETETVPYQMGFMQYNSWTGSYYDYGGARLNIYSCPSFNVRRTWNIGRISGSTYSNVVGYNCNGQSATKSVATLQFDANCPYILGNIMYNGANIVIDTYTNLKQMKLYGVKIYENYGASLVGDYIPVLTENNVATLYDSISDGYATTYGTVIAGPTKQ